MAVQWHAARVEQAMGGYLVTAPDARSGGMKRFKVYLAEPTASTHYSRAARVYVEARRAYAGWHRIVWQSVSANGPTGREAMRAVKRHVAATNEEA